MLNTNYIYGESAAPSKWALMPYKGVLKLKIKLASQKVAELNAVHYLSRDSDNINKCLQSIKFNTVLLEELKE